MIAGRLREQARWCRRLGSPLYVGLLDHAADDFETKGPTAEVLRGHENDRPESALALRFLGAVHRLVLEGRTPELARFYPSAGGDSGRGDPWPAFRAVLAEEKESLRALVDRPVQTNEVGRSAALVGGFLLVARESGLPLRCLEIGASAGLNLRWDRFRYETETGAWGDPASPVRFGDVFLAGRPPFDVGARVVERRGCDLLPVDPTSAEGSTTLRSYVWADQVERRALLDAAIDVARDVPVAIDRASAPDWLANRLTPLPEGTATIVFHSIVSQYLATEDRKTVAATLERAGRTASPRARLAWLSLEPFEDGARVRLTTWPGGEPRVLALATHHGRDIRWLASR